MRWKYKEERERVMVVCKLGKAVQGMEWEEVGMVWAYDPCPFHLLYGPGAECSHTVGHQALLFFWASVSSKGMREEEERGAAVGG